MSKVAVIQCTSYDPEKVYAGLKRGLELFGGIESFISPEEKILLKPNLLRGKSPESAVTTHPAVFEAVIRLVQEAGCEHLSYGDSPGTGNSEKVAKEAGLYPVAQQYHVPMADFSSGQTVSYPEGQVAKEFEIAQGVLESDAIISLCKMKTHGLTRITGAIKNQYGCIYGLNKGAGHALYPVASSFSEMLIDLNLYVKPRLFIMDAIVAMEGNGPASGDPVSMNCLLISDDPVALDAVFCQLVALDPALVHPITAGQAMGLGSYEDIEIIGDDITDLINPRFNVDRSPDKNETQVSFLLENMKHLKGLLVRKPVMLASRCIGCGLCEKACPLETKAIVMRKKGGQSYPRYDYHRCIRCYCCQEMCPQKAIKVHTPVLGKLFLYR